LKASASEVISFFSSLWKEGKTSFNVAHKIRSAMHTLSSLSPSSTIPSHLDSPTVSAVFKAWEKQQRPMPKYRHRTEVILSIKNLLRSWPDNAQLTLQQLRTKAVLLLRIATFRRSDELSRIAFKSIEFYDVESQQRQLVFATVASKTNPSWSLPITVGAASDQKLCPVLAVYHYIQASARLLPSSYDRERLFVALAAPFRPLSRDTMSNIVQDVFTTLHIPPHITPHYLRLAAASAALDAGVQESDVLWTGGWSDNSRAFRTHYDRRLQPKIVASLL